MRERMRARAESDATEDGAGDSADFPPPHDLLEAFRQFGAIGRAGLGAAGDTAKSLRSLLAADVSLARSAFGRTLALTGFAIASGASAWLFLMGALAAVLNGPAGLPGWAALLIPAALSLSATAFAGWKAMQYFEHTRLQATRRQLARLGIGELSRFMPDADSAASAREASDRHSPEDSQGEPLKDERGVEVTPP